MDEPEKEEGEYEVEQIVDDDEVVKPNGTRERYYRVRWKGYDPEEDTWEPAENLENAVEAIIDYWQTDYAKEKHLAMAANNEIEYISVPDQYYDADNEMFCISEPSPPPSLEEYTEIMGPELAWTYDC
jgi:hypothetical protein